MRSPKKGSSRARAFLALLGAAHVVGCFADPTATNADPRPDAPGAHAADARAAESGQQLDASTDPTEWSYVYARYFGPGTVGHCGNSGCHESRQGGFRCGSDEASCFEGLVAGGLVDLAQPGASDLGKPGTSPLAWYDVGVDGIASLDGRMPDDNPVANSEAAAAVTRWLAAGAKHGAVAQGGEADAGTHEGAADASVEGDASHGDGGPHDSGASDGATVDAGHDAGAPPPTWTSLYASYFGPGTPGHCGNSGCHNVTRSGFKCGTSASACYQGLVTAGLVSKTDPAHSVLGTVGQSPLAWFGGAMPKDAATANPKAKAAVTAWLNGGAQ